MLFVLLFENMHSETQQEESGCIADGQTWVPSTSLTTLMWPRAALSPQIVWSLYLWDSGISLLMISVSSQGTVSNTFLPTWQVNVFLYLHIIRHNPVSSWYSLWLHPETLSSHYGQHERLRLWRTYCCDPVYSAEECQLQTQGPLFVYITKSRRANMDHTFIRCR